MGATPFVIALVGLVFPIAMLLLALLFDLVIAAWAIMNWGRGRFVRLRRELAMAQAHVQLSAR